MSTETVFPIIHWNGTSAEALISDLTAALEKIQEAKQALCQTAPNLRDYYLHEGDFNEVFESAKKAHFARLQMLDAIANQLQEQAEYIADPRRNLGLKSSKKKENCSQ